MTPRALSNTQTAFALALLSSLSACSGAPSVAPAIGDATPNVIGVPSPGSRGGSTGNGPQFTASQSGLTEPLGAFCARSGPALLTPAPSGAGLCTNAQAEAVLGHAVCACGDVKVAHSLATDWTGRAAVSHGAVGINGSLELGSAEKWQALRAAGDLVIGSTTGVHFDPNAARGMGLEVGGSLSVAGPVALNADLLVSGDAAVGGDIDAGNVTVSGMLTQPGGSAIVSRSLTVGAQTAAAVDVAPPCECDALDVPRLVACASGHNDNEQIDFGSDALSGYLGDTQVELPCGRLYVPAARGAGNLTLVVSGRSALFVQGDLAVGGDLSIETRGGGELDLFVEGSLLTTGSLKLPSTGKSDRVRIFLGGSAPLTLSQVGTHVGGLYAPTADVTISADLELYGFLMVHQLTNQGHSIAHYDSGLLPQTSACQ